MSSAMLFIWEGDAMKPANGFWGKRADQEFTIGERYTIEAVEERSARSHAHYFAALHEAWLNLPEDLSERYPSVEHLRKRALIKAGYRDEQSIVCASKAEAQRVAAFIRPMDDYAMITVSEAVVTRYTAKSQSSRAMGKEVFQESKQKVLDLVAEMIGVQAGQLSGDPAQEPTGALPADAPSTGTGQSETPAGEAGAQEQAQSEADQGGGREGESLGAKNPPADGPQTEPAGFAPSAPAFDPLDWATDLHVSLDSMTLDELNAALKTQANIDAFAALEKSNPGTAATLNKAISARQVELADGKRG